MLAEHLRREPQLPVPPAVPQPLLRPAAARREPLRLVPPVVPQPAVLLRQQPELRRRLQGQQERVLPERLASSPTA